MHLGHEEVGELVDELAGAGVAHAAAMLSAESIEDRKSDAKERNAQPIGRLPTMAVRDEQLGLRTTSSVLEVRQVTDYNVARQLVEERGRVR